eukprot:Phypoly_transcript_01585.p1 GENE.Phypoly_transcript_01585~~Phypoly_transcript_01585.p1  ORF type:complete len:1072 (+),score=167.91 Phypoly_transcript_01585:208-3216(+)
MNEALRKELGYNTLAARESVEPSDCTFHHLESKDGKYHGQVTLKSAQDTTIIFFIEGQINYIENICYFKLLSTKDKGYLLQQAYEKAGFQMTILESNAESYDWRHLLPNNQFWKMHNMNSSHYEFTASERYDERVRREYHLAFDRSKKTGASVEVDSSISGFSLPSGAFMTYLYTDPNTDRDIVNVVIFDSSMLHSSQDRIAELSDFFQNAPLMMGVVELSGDHIKMLYANNETKQFLVGKDVTTIDLTMFFGKEILERYIQLYKKSRESMRVEQTDINSYEYQRYAFVTASCLSYNKETNTSRHVFIIADKTEQRLAEYELRKYKDSLESTVKERTLELQAKEQELRSLVDNAPNIILSVDRNGLVVFANRDLLGGDASLLIGKCLYTAVLEGPELKELIRMLFETKRSFSSEVKLVETDIWLTLNVGIINDNLATIVATDITAIKKMAEELNDALTTKSRFLANMSHEVRTPLSGIIGMSRMLQETGLTMDQTECVSTIQCCGETLLSVINSILDYTKLEATGTTMDMDNSEFSLQQCLEESIYTILPVARQKKLELILDIDPRVSDRILGDMIRLRQVMLNLLNNAVKFTEVGYIVVSLTSEEIEGSEDHKYYFTISDTGCGVPLESQGKLFQMFSQVDVSTTRRYGGTGIGLALAKRFVELMDGEIKLRSTGVAGEGSSFLFSITATPAPFVPISPSGSLSSPRWLTNSTNIYIFESCKISSEVLKKRLVAKGFLAIQSISENPYAHFEEIKKFATTLECTNILIFCDLDLLSPSQPFPLVGISNVATVFMSYMRPPNFESAFPAQDFLRKPIKESALISCLREIWGKFDTKPRALPLQPSSSIKRANAPQVFPLNILVVEDNEINQKVIRRVFQHLGYTMVIGNNGMEALQIIEERGMPDMIVMDVQMPILDGVQTTKIIREKYPRTWVYIVAMTANAFPEDRKNCLDAGMDDFLTKPLRVEQLQLALQKCNKLKIQNAANTPSPSKHPKTLHVSVS